MAKKIEISSPQMHAAIFQSLAAYFLQHPDQLFDSSKPQVIESASWTGEVLKATEHAIETIEFRRKRHLD